jgi:hypothetical protein
MSGNPEPASSPWLDKSLRFAFPFWLEELHQKPIDYLLKRASKCSKVIAEKGDILMYGSKKTGGPGDVFNHLAEGMACLVLITKNPVPFAKNVFYPNGEVKTFATDELANKEVWPDV